MVWLESRKDFTKREAGPRVPPWAIVLLAVMVVSVGVLVLVETMWPRAVRRRISGTMKCLQQMYKVHGALKAFSQANEGRFPDDLDELLKQGYLDSADSLVCVVSAEDEASDHHAEGTAGHRYVYLGKGLSLSKDSGLILFYDRYRGHHGHDQMNVMYVDGVARNEFTQAAVKLIEEQKAGRLPASRPAASAVEGEPFP
jgi:hypothetical protein